MVKWLTIGILFSALIATVAFFVPERNRAPFSNSEGVIWHGERFGVVVGQPETINRRNLEQQGWSYDHTEMGGGCIRHHYAADYTVTVFFDESWRSGTLCVISKGHSVRAIEWFYGPFWLDL